MSHNSRQFSVGRKTSAYSGDPKAKGIKPILFYSVFAGLLTTNVLTLVAFLMSTDITNLASYQTDHIRTAYQDRIVQLRQDVDRLHSRQYAQAGNLNLQLQELSSQQEMLNVQHSYVKALASQASELGLKTATADALTPTPDPLITGALMPTQKPGVSDLLGVSQSIQQMMNDNRLALTALSEAAITSTDSIVEKLDKIGVKTDLPSLSTGTGVGGPYEPPQDGQETYSLLNDANMVMSAFERFRIARETAMRAPINRPISSSARISSNFGNRKDPFLNRSAFHAGMDFAATTGTKVLSAAPGKIIFAGRKGGYGKVIEIEHTGGFTTRYAHLSAFIGKVGQRVETGTTIAKVGSTGRSTGPHLHFEVRKDGQPVNPAKFLQVGKELANLL